MPTYEYRCEACGATFDLFESISAEPTRDCPECGEPKAKRLLSCGAGFLMKGAAKAPSCPAGGSCCGSDLPAGERPCR